MHNCEALTNLLIVRGSSSLRSLDLSGCSRLSEINILFGDLSCLLALQHLDVSFCGSLQLVPTSQAAQSGERVRTWLQGLKSYISIGCPDLDET